MSVQFVGARSSDDRRRRRLAVSAEGSGTALSPEDAARIERRGLSADSIVAVAAPWIPQALWRIWTAGVLLLVGLALVGIASVRPLALRPELQSLQTHLLEQSRPVLVDYLQSVVWTGITAWALLIGWYRSRSESDFGGRYRIWTWFAGLLAVVGFCAGTDAHQALARIAVEFKLLPEHVGSLIWQIPLLSAGLPLGLIIDRDLRRSRMTLILYRITAVVLLTAAAAPLFQQALAGAPWFEYAAILLPLTGMGLLFLTLWLQSWCVAYFCPDPPEIAAGRPSLLIRVLGPIAVLFGSLSRLFRRKPADGGDEEAPKPRRRRKKADADTESEAAPAAARRKRKAPAKRTTKPRTRTRKVEGEETEAEGPDESSNWDEESTAEESWNESSADADDAAEWSEPEETPPTRKASSSAKSSSTSRHSAPEPEDESSPSEEWSDDEGNDYRVDGPSADQLRGLSKKQRRELRKQWKDQQRSS